MYENYCKLRDARGLKDATVAKEAGITKSTFSDWKIGRSRPKDAKLKKIANFFGVSVEKLTTGNDAKNEKYYMNDEAAEIAQEIFENKELKMLFDVSKNATAQRLSAYYKMIKAMEEQENGN